MSNAGTYTVGMLLPSHAKIETQEVNKTSAAKIHFQPSHRQPYYLEKAHEIIPFLPNINRYYTAVCSGILT